jgi:acyl-CoA synthetase (AMP-forming)/AMP-acid ligase II
LKGYYNNPDATKAAFDGDWFRTGDLFRRDDAGYFYIVGRIKDMIRRAGENISAREVETVVVAMPEVSEAAAVPVKDPVRGEEIKIYIVPREGQEKSQHLIDRIIAHCTANLAAFKVPRFYVFRDSLPKTASGKISKPGLVADQADLRAGSYDRVERKQL